MRAPYRVLSRRRAAGLVAWVLLLILGARAEAAQEPDMSEVLIRRVEHKDWDVIPAMKGASPAVVDDLVVLARSSSDSEVRELALWCLNQADGAKARSAFVAALKDPGEDIRDKALRFLHRNHDAADLPALLPHLTSHPDDFVREQVALIIGEIGSRSAIPDLERALAQPQPEPVPHAIRLALARLGQPASRAEIFAGLSKATVSERRAALEDFAYIADPGETHRLIPLLSDRRPAVNIGRSGTTNTIRVCDLTVEVVSSILREPFSFSTETRRSFSDEELAEAGRVISGP
jgi:HEAT repeat protein